jgi:integrase
MARPKGGSNDYPENMWLVQTDGLFRVRNPLTGKVKKFGREREQEARNTAKALNEWLKNERALRSLTAGQPMIDGLVVKWIEDRLPFQPWAASTRRNYLAKLERIKRELGKRPIAHTDCLYLDEWLNRFCKTADTYNDWRYVFSLLWEFAVFRKWATENEGGKLIERSTSKKIEANKKQRDPLDLAGFKLIHEKAPAWLQLAMDSSLVTLQARLEVCNFQHAHIRDGYWYVIRNKVSGDSDMAFIRIAMTEQLDELQRRARLLDDIASPFLIHRRPDSMRREWIDPKPHWSYVMPDYLTKAFEKARDSVPQFAQMAKGTRPPFHEIRGLGSRLYAEQGMRDRDIQALMTHSNPSTTKIYLDGGAEALRDDDYLQVSAPLRLRDIFR